MTPQEFIEASKQSNLWSKDHGLPVFVGTNNGWLYMAYWLMCLTIIIVIRNPTERVDSQRIRSVLGSEFISNLLFLLDRCQVRTGVYKRIDSDIPMSHDEILGLSYIFMTLGLIGHAERLHTALKNRLWSYDPETFFNPKRFMARFAYLPYCVRVSAGLRPGWLATKMMRCYIRLEAFSRDQGAGGRLRLFLTNGFQQACGDPQTAGLWTRWWNRQTAMGWSIGKMLRLELRAYPVMHSF